MWKTEKKARKLLKHCIERPISAEGKTQTEPLEGKFSYLLNFHIPERGSRRTFEWRACSNRLRETFFVSHWRHSLVSVNSKESFSTFCSFFFRFRFASIIIKKGSFESKAIFSWLDVLTELIVCVKRTKRNAWGSLRSSELFFFHMFWPWNFCFSAPESSQRALCLVYECWRNNCCKNFVFHETV